jgi:hypothetical protein
MKNLLFIFLLTISGNLLAQEDALNNYEVSTQCKDYLDGKRNANAGFCLGFFYKYNNEVNNYWDNQRPSYSAAEREFWDIAFPCRIKTDSENQLIKIYYDYVQDNPLVRYDWSFLTIGKSLQNFC